MFISGSRQIDSLPEELEERIANIVDQDIPVLIGDSERGVDARIAEDLRKRKYTNVTVYTIHDTPRIKVPEDWDIVQVSPKAEEKSSEDGKPRKQKERETEKDRAMGDACKYGLIVWQDTYMHPRYGQLSVSSGSLRNAIQLLLNNKPVVLYRRYRDEFGDTLFSLRELKDIEDLQELVKSLEEIVQKRFEKLLKAEEEHLKAGEQLALDFSEDTEE
ncbi:MAG: hypothetical protein LBS17_05765 [Actinomycetes bacterium]|nr:hypothetical protein [Actinomycetes bacterium]